MPRDITPLTEGLRTAPQSMRRIGGGLWAWLKQAPQTVRRAGGGLWARFKRAPRALQAAIGAGVLVVTALLAVLMFSLLKGEAEVNVTAQVVRGDIEYTVLATGVLEPTRLVNVGAQASGRVQRLYVTLGQQVEEGALIAEIDATTQRNNVRTAEAQLRSARAQRAASAASLNEAELHLRRQRELLAVDAVSRADYESAEAAALAQRAQVASLDAQIQQAQLALSTANANLGYTRITAPMAGTVVAIVSEEGQTVNAAQQAPTIVRLAELSTMTIKAEISEADVGRVAPGQAVYFTTLGDPDTRHYATLRAIEPGPTTIEAEAQTSADQAVYYNGLFDVDNADGALRTGMTAQVYIVLGQAENVLTIPAAALGAEGRDGRYAVQVVAASGRIETRQVRIGLNNNVLAEVQDGLAEGEEVVIAQSTEDSAMESRIRGGMMGGGRPPP